MIGAVSNGLDAERKGAALAARGGKPRRRRKPVRRVSHRSQARARWRRRAGLLGAVLSALAVVAVADAVLDRGAGDGGREGPFETALADIFPEAPPERIEVRRAPTPIGGMEAPPLSASLLLPDHLLSPSEEQDPFLRLSRVFRPGGAALTGPQMARRIDRVVAAAGYPETLPRCPTYAIGERIRMARGSGVSVPMRRLDIRLNPGC